MNREERHNRDRRPRFVRLGLLVLAAGMLAGCGEPARVAGLRTRPTDPELPRVRRLRPVRSTAVRVGVEGRPEPRIVLVPDLSRPHYTPEERRVLGLDRPKQPDRFEKLYPPPRGVHQGVSPDSGGVATGIGGLGSAAVARSGPRSRAGVATADVAGRVSGVSEVLRKAAAWFLRPISPWGYGPPVWVHVGVAPARTKAGRSSSEDY